MWTWCERLVAPRTHARSALDRADELLLYARQRTADDLLYFRPPLDLLGGHCGGRRGRAGAARHLGGPLIEGYVVVVVVV